MTIVLPDRESIELLHEAVLMYSGGKPGVHDEKLVLGAIERPLTYTQYVNEYDLDTICALLIDSVARNHGFRDGNKRTALLTAIFTYRVNGIYFIASKEMNEDFDELVMWVVNKKPSVQALTKRLKKLRSLYQGKKESWGALFGAFAKAMLDKDKD